MQVNESRPEQKAAALIRQRGTLVRLTEALELGIHRDTIWKMRDSGALEQVSRGLYRLTDGRGIEQPDLVTVAKRVPGSVVCLISALALHELTTQIPHAVDIALARGRRRPRLDHPPIRVYWWGPDALRSGIDSVTFSGISVRVTNPERSVADAFRYRHKLGLELAIEALRVWRERRGARPDSLLAAARTVRVDRVIRPYLQAVL